MELMVASTVARELDPQELCQDTLLVRMSSSATVSLLDKRIYDPKESSIREQFLTHILAWEYM